MRFLLFSFIFLIVFNFSSFSQVFKVYQGKVEDFIKYSTPFRDGFVFSTPKKVFYFSLKDKTLRELSQVSDKVGSIITSLSSYSNYLFV
ncbi:MAG: hypothetical protein ACP5KI_04335, partial [Brevinematia bacterium]